MPELDPNIMRYYMDEWDEDNRIRSGVNELEFVRTREIIQRYLPECPVRVLDLGGGAGVHAEWLLEAGHQVVLVDPIPRHIEQANAALGDRDGFSASVGDGRALEFDDSSFEVVLLLGPLYHLTERDDRVRVWAEARRVSKPEGVVIAAMITRFASLFSGLSEDVLFDPEFRDVVARDLANGQHRNPEGRDFFTTAYFHHPQEIESEAGDGGLAVESLLGVEGIAAWIPRLEKSWPDPERREIIIDAARAIESEPSLVGLGPHIIAVARPAGD